MGEMKELLARALLEQVLEKKRGDHPAFRVGHIVGRLEMALSNINAAQRKIDDEKLDEILGEAKDYIKEALKEMRTVLRRLRGRD